MRVIYYTFPATGKIQVQLRNTKVNDMPMDELVDMIEKYNSAGHPGIAHVAEFADDSLEAHLYLLATIRHEEHRQAIKDVKEILEAAMEAVSYLED